MAVNAKLVGLFWFWSMFEIHNTSATICHSPQFLQLGQRGMVSCEFPETFYGIYWHNVSQVTSDYPVIQLKEGNVEGDGYTSGEFDIFPNGSLIINNVSLIHNHEFGVLLLPTENNASFQGVRVIVFATPNGPYPSTNITGCEFENLCLLSQLENKYLSCIVDNVGEVIDDLSWILRTTDGDKIFTRSFNVTKSDNELQSYRVDVSVPLVTHPALSLYVCSSTSQVPEVGSSERAILVDHGTLTSPSDPPLITLSVAPNEILTMRCGTRDVLFLVWKKRRDDGITEVVAFRLSNVTGERSYQITSDGLIFRTDNSLVIRANEHWSEGVYVCVYSENGLATSISSYKVRVMEQRNQPGSDVIAIMIVSGLVIAVIMIAAAVAWRWHHRRKCDEGSAGQVEPEVEPDPEGQEMKEPEPAIEMCDDVIISAVHDVIQPHDVLTMGNEIFVLQKGGIKAYNMTDGRMTKRYDEELIKPFAGVFLDGTLYVTDKTYKCVMAFDNSLNCIRTFGHEHLTNPAGITACKEDKCIYVLTGRTKGDAAVAKFNLAGDYVSQLLNDELLDPWYIKRGPMGQFYISDFERKTVDIFESDFRRSVASYKTTMPGQTQDLNCRGMDVDEAGNFFVALRAPGKGARYESIVKYDKYGRYVETLEDSPAVWFRNSDKSLQFVRGLHYYRSNTTHRMWLMAVDPGNERVKMIPLN